MILRYGENLLKGAGDGGGGKVALVSDRNMAKHCNVGEPGHPECPERILARVKQSNVLIPPP